MKLDKEQLSALIDDDITSDSVLDELIMNEQQQQQFSRYYLIGDTIRGEVNDPLFNIDISEKVMAQINQQTASAVTDNIEPLALEPEQNKRNNIIPFVKRFGQYAIAASVAGIVVVASLVNSPSVVEKNDSGIEVLNTVPFGGSVTPVSLQATQKLSKEELKERDERLEALLKDHQLQLQTQP